MAASSIPAALLPRERYAAEEDHFKKPFIAPLHQKRQRDAVGKISNHKSLLKTHKTRSMLREADFDDEVLARELTASADLATSVGDEALARELRVTVGLIASSSLPSRIPLYPPTIPVSLQPPSSLYDAERIMHLTQTYVRGSFDAQIWHLHPITTFSCARCDSTEADLKAPNNFYSLFVCFHRTMRSPKRDFNDAFEFLDKTLAHFSQVLKEQHHNTLLQLFHIIMRFVDANIQDSEMLTTTMNFFSKMATAVLGKLHPLTQTLKLLCSVEQSFLADTVARGWEILAASFEEQLDMAHPVSLNCRLKMVESVFVRPGTFEKAEELLWALLSTSLAIRGLKDIHSMSIEYSLARLYAQQGRHAECIDKASEILAYCNALLTEDKHAAAAALQSSVVCLMASSRYQNGQYDTAEADLRQYVQIRSFTWGWQSTLTLHALLSLEEFLVATKKEQEAYQVKQQRLNILANLSDPNGK